MSNASNRRASTPPSCVEIPCDSKRELESRLKDYGYTLTSYRKNVGNWNESRDWFAREGLNETWLENTSKGDRPDWAIMWKTFTAAMHGGRR